MESKAKTKEENIKIGKQIKKLRIDNDLRREDLCGVLGISTSTLSKYESGEIEIGIHTIRILIKRFKVPSAYFFVDDDNTEYVKIPKEFAETIKNVYIALMKSKVVCNA